MLLGLATFLWCLPGIAVRGTFGAHVAVDEPQYLLSATSLWEDLDLDISDELADERWRTYHRSRLPEQTELLGPVEDAPTPGTDLPVHRLTLRTPRPVGSALVRAISEAVAIRSARKSEGALRIVVDPVSLG